MEQVLADELHVAPSKEAFALREALLALDERPATVATPSEHGLLERDRELGRLDRCVAAAHQGRGSVVLVSGDPGVGESALGSSLLEAVPRDGPDGVTVLVGSCDDLVAPRSLGPFQDMVVMPGHDDGGLHEVLLTAAMPEVLPALLAFLGRGVTIAVIEDLHWADDATLDAMRYLARRVTTA